MPRAWLRKNRTNSERCLRSTMRISAAGFCCCRDLVFEIAGDHGKAGQRYAAVTHHQLGQIAQGQRDFAPAETWHLKSLEIMETQGNKRGVAVTCHDLGSIAQERRDFAKAGSFFVKALQGFMAANDDHNAGNALESLTLLLQDCPTEMAGNVRAAIEEGLGEDTRGHDVR